MLGKTWNRRLGATASVVVLASLAACGSTDSSGSAVSSGSKSGDFVLGISQPVGANEATRNWQRGAEVQAKSLGMKTVSADANLDPNKQLSDVQSMISQGVDALCISPLDPQGMQPVIHDAVSRGIPVIGWSAGAGAKERGYATDFETDDVLAGEDAARVISEKVGKGAQVALIQGPPAIPVAAQRAQGFEAGAKKYGLDLVAEQLNSSADSTSGATPIADAWKAKYGSNLKAIFSYNDPSALGAAASVGNGFKPLLVGVNGSGEAMDAIKQGRMLATYDQRAVEIGNACAWAADQALTHKDLPPVITVHMPRYDSANVAQWQSPEKLLKKAIDVSVKEQGGGATLVTDVKQP